MPLGTTATINVVDAAGAYSPSTTLGITPTADLPDYYDNAGTTADTDQGCGNLDGDGFSLSQQAPTAAACAPDNVLADAQTVLVHGLRGDSTLGLLGTSTSGVSQGLILINYSDGTSSSATVTLGDWARAPVTPRSPPCLIGTPIPARRSN